VTRFIVNLNCVFNWFFLLALRAEPDPDLETEMHVLQVVEAFLENDNIWEEPSTHSSFTFSLSLFSSPLSFSFELNYLFNFFQ
jgi:hypothetical protein